MTTCDRCVAVASCATLIHYVDHNGTAQACALHWCDHHHRQHQDALTKALVPA